METETQMKYAKLRQLQSLSLDSKIILAKQRIREFSAKMDGNVCVSFSGGADSTVLLHIARQVIPDVKAVFVNTGLEFPEIVRFVRSVENVDIVKPKMSFKQVLTNYGYPVISKEVSKEIQEIRTAKSEKLLKIRVEGAGPGKMGKLPDKWHFLLDAPFKISDRCCYMLKKQPLYAYHKSRGLFPIVGVMADESRSRVLSYLRYGCNAFNLKTPQSRPLMVWTKQDVLQYIKRFNVPYCRAVYGDLIPGDLFNDGECLKFSKAQRTGCTFCMFGSHLENPNKFQMMHKENPKMWKYCIEYLGLGPVLEYCHIPYKGE